MTWINSKKCNACEECVFVCLNNAIITIDGKFTIDNEKCKQCHICMSYCPVHAIQKKRVENQNFSDKPVL